MILKPGQCVPDRIILQRVGPSTVAAMRSDAGRADARNSITSFVCDMRSIVRVCCISRSSRRCRIIIDVASAASSNWRTASKIGTRTCKCRSCSRSWILFSCQTKLDQDVDAWQAQRSLPDVSWRKHIMVEQAEPGRLGIAAVSDLAHPLCLSAQQVPEHGQTSAKNVKSVIEILNLMRFGVLAFVYWRQRPRAPAMVTRILMIRLPGSKQAGKLEPKTTQAPSLHLLSFGYLAIERFAQTLDLGIVITAVVHRLRFESRFHKRAQRGLLVIAG